MEGIHMPEGGKKGKYKRIGVKIGTVVMVMQDNDLYFHIQFTDYKDADSPLHQWYEYAGLSA